MNPLDYLIYERGPSEAPHWRRFARHYRMSARFHGAAVVWFRVISPLMLVHMLGQWAQEGSWLTATCYAAMVYVGAYALAPVSRATRAEDLRDAQRCDEIASYLAAGLFPPHFLLALRREIERQMKGAA